MRIKISKMETTTAATTTEADKAPAADTVAKGAENSNGEGAGEAAATNAVSVSKSSFFCNCTIKFNSSKFPYSSSFEKNKRYVCSLLASVYKSVGHAVRG